MYGLPISRVRLSDQIVEQLISFIRDGKLKPGDKLPSENELMKSFAVGRSSVREAIRALTLMGVLTVRPGHGTYVNTSTQEFLAKPLSWGFPLDNQNIDECLEARLVVEQAIVELAALRATDEDIEQITRCHTRIKSGGKIRRKFLQADLAFHVEIAKASHNALLARFLTQIRHLTRATIERYFPMAEGYETSIEHHAKILDAIKAHDAEQARVELRHHIEFVRDKLNVGLGLTSAIMKMSVNKKKKIRTLTES